MAVQVIRAECWADLDKLLFDNSWNSANPDRSRYAFRGVEDEKYRLCTSLMRLGGEQDLHYGSKIEDDILHEFKEGAYHSITQYNDNDNVWHILSRAQHYGLPTRLLDWTTSPYVALYFVTIDARKYDTDGAIWRVDIEQVHNNLPPKLNEVSQQHRRSIYTTEMLNEVVPSLDSFSEMKNCHGNFAVFFEPPPFDPRIINQSGFFSLMPDSNSLFDDWLKLSDKGKHSKIIIPKKLKRKIRNKLDQLNIIERMLFPGLDGLCDWLKRCYSPDNVQNT